MAKTFHHRHDYLIKRLCNMSDIKVVPADGTFYLFPYVQKIIEKRGFVNDVEFAESLLKSNGF